jgi:type II secretory ATPase GspE/PulE/Tfp pilus assembly ATPase PilB-like protein
MLATAQAASPRRMEERAEDLLRRGVAAGSSDIHLDPGPDGLVVRFRTDGLLAEIERHPATVARPLVDAFLRLAGLPAETIDAASRRPVTGRIFREMDGRNFAMGVATFPLIDGPKLTVRLYVRERARASLADLGHTPEDRARLEQWRARPNGLILVAGPSGSGKTTNLYALVEHRTSEGANTIAIERSPFARLRHVHQVQLDPAAGLTHAAALHAIMRGLDPDVIMVGDVLDRETAFQLPDAAISGHLVLACLEASDAVTAIRSLLDLGADPWTLSQTLVGVSAQRLARRICPHCRVERPVPPRSLEALGWQPAEAPPTFSGEGCDRCRKRGLLGRVAFYTLLEVTSALAARIAENAPADDLAAAAGKTPSSFLQYARRAVADGLVTPEEAARVVRQA